MPFASVPQSSYRNGVFTPADLLPAIRQRAAELADHSIYITLLTAKQMQFYMDALGDTNMDIALSMNYSKSAMSSVFQKFLYLIYRRSTSQYNFKLYVINRTNSLLN